MWINFILVYIVLNEFLYPWKEIFILVFIFVEKCVRLYFVFLRLKHFTIVFFFFG